MTVLHGVYPITPAKVICINNPFASTGASRVRDRGGSEKPPAGRATRWWPSQRRRDLRHRHPGAFSALERGTDFIYVCYDNEGIQEYGHAALQRQPRRRHKLHDPILSKLSIKRHDPHSRGPSNPVRGNASPAFPLDLYDKFRTAKAIHGRGTSKSTLLARRVGVFRTVDHIKMGKLAVETGIQVALRKSRRPSSSASRPRFTDTCRRAGRRPLRTMSRARLVSKRSRTTRIQKLQELPTSGGKRFFGEDTANPRRIRLLHVC